MALVVTMLFALCVPAFAEDSKIYPRYNTYMCVGDSIAAGCGLARDGNPTNFDQNIEDFTKVYSNDYVYLGYDFSTVPAAYHSIVANALDTELLQCARSGLRAVEFRYMLDGVYNDYDKTRFWGNTYFDTDGNGFTMDDLKALNAYVNYPEKIKQTDLLSINVGSNDVFSFTLNMVLQELTKDTSDPDLGAIKDYIDKTGNLGAAFGKLVDAYKSAGKMASLVSTLTSTMYKAYNQYRDNFDALINKIYKLNPDITVVVVGVYNPFANFKLSADSELDLNGIAAPVVAAINLYLQSYKLKLSNYYYADVVGTETYPMNYDDHYFWEYFGLKVHPTIEGYQFMAQQILKAIPEALPAPVVTAGNKATTGKITLKWDAVDGAASYEIYRSTSADGTFTKLYAMTGTSFTNTSANAGDTYYYKVKAISDSKNIADSDFSAVVKRTCDLPAPVVTAGNNATTGKVTLKWDAVDGASKYEIYRSTSADGTFTKLYTMTGTSFTNTSAVAGKTYYYKVKAIFAQNADANSAFSAVVKRACDLARPVVSISLNSSGNPKLTWNAVDGADSYVVYRATSKTGTYTKLYTTSGKMMTNTSAKAGTTYYYKVMAVCSSNSAANSAYSSIVSIKAK